MQQAGRRAEPRRHPGPLSQVFFSYSPSTAASGQTWDMEIGYDAQDFGLSNWDLRTTTSDNPIADTTSWNFVMATFTPGVGSCCSGIKLYVNGVESSVTSVNPNSNGGVLNTGTDVAKCAALLIISHPQLPACVACAHECDPRLCMIFIIGYPIYQCWLSDRWMV